MTRQLIIFALTLALVAGCKFSGNDPARVSFEDALLDSDLNPSIATTPHLTPSAPAIGSISPYETYEHGPLEDFNFTQPGNYRRISLDQCIASALQNSPVIRELGGVILRSPDTTVTDNDPALAYADPRFGEQAALSEFDAIYRGQLLFQKNDGLFNNQFIGDEGAFQQDLAEYRSGITKLAANGARYGFNHVINYELNNSPSNRFNGTGSTSFAYDTFFEAEVRQPLFQGAGTTFNRIAGPNNAVGVYNGVLIARVNTDIALADFEASVRDLISDIENAYWDLYFAYRDLEAKIEARNGAFDIWRNVEANKGEKSAAIIGQAKEQYYRFAAEVEDAIQGRLNEGTRTNNGSSGGTFRRTGGVRTTERRLRLITGMVLNDSQLLVPSEMPVDAASVFDWDQSKDSAFSLRPELRRQRWRIKARELELLASKNHLLPRVDLLATYRARGFGRNLFGDGNELIQDGTLEEQSDSSAFGTLLSNDLQEWELGVDVSVPIGFRVQHAAQRHAELNLSREISVLREQERQVAFGLSNAIGELNRTNRVRRANLNRLNAANEQFEAIQNIWREQDTTIDLVLEAQRRVIEAKLQYFQTQVECMLAIKAIHFEQGTLFAYHNVALSESQAEQLAEQQHLRRRQSPQRAISYWLPGLTTSHGLGVTHQPPAAPTGIVGYDGLVGSADAAPLKNNTGPLEPILDLPSPTAIVAGTNVSPEAQKDSVPAPLFAPDPESVANLNQPPPPIANSPIFNPNIDKTAAAAIDSNSTEPRKNILTNTLFNPNAGRAVTGMEENQAKPSPIFNPNIDRLPAFSPKSNRLHSQNAVPANPLFNPNMERATAPAQTASIAKPHKPSTHATTLKQNVSPISPMFNPNIDRLRPIGANSAPTEPQKSALANPLFNPDTERQNNGVVEASFQTMAPPATSATTPSATGDNIIAFPPPGSSR